MQKVRQIKSYPRMYKYNSWFGMAAWMTLSWLMWSTNLRIGIVAHAGPVNAAVVDVVDAAGVTISSQKFLYVLNDQIDGDQVICPPRNNYVGVLLSRQAEFFKGGFDKIGILMEDLLQITSSLRHVPQNSA